MEYKITKINNQWLVSTGQLSTKVNGLEEAFDEIYSLENAREVEELVEDDLPEDDDHYYENVIEPLEKRLAKEKRGE